MDTVQRADGCSYEAYVLYSFFSLLVAYLGGVEELEELLELIPPQAHPFPMCNMPKYKPGSKFLLWCRRCILQFVFVKPVLAIISILLEWAHLYGDGSLSPAKGYLWIAIVNNVSITVCTPLFLFPTAGLTVVTGVPVLSGAVLHGY